MDNEHKIFIDIKDKVIRQGKFMILIGFQEVDLDEDFIYDLIQARISNKGVNRNV